MNEKRLLEALDQQIKSNENLYYIIWGLHDKSKALRSDIINQDRQASNLKSEIQQLKAELVGQRNETLAREKAYKEIQVKYNMARSHIMSLKEENAGLELILESIEEIYNKAELVNCGNPDTHEEMVDTLKVAYQVEKRYSEEFQKRYEEEQSKASKLNAEKRKLFELIRALPYTSKVANLWEKFTEYQDQRRKKGGK